MEKPWLSNYPEGVPTEVDCNKYKSLVHLMEDSFAKYASRPAYTNMGKTLTFAEIDEQSKAFAAYLQTHAKLQKGDRVAIQMPNCLQYPIVMFGALRAGLIVVNTNPLYTEREMEHQFSDSGAKAVIILANFASKLEPILAKTDIETVVVTELGDLLGGLKGTIVNLVVKYLKKMVPAYHLPQATSLKKAMALGKESTFNPVEAKGDEVAFLQYTGGTTGVSKGAMLTHNNIVANLLQNHAWIAPALKNGEETIVTALPLYHIFSLTVNCLTMMSVGSCNLLITNPKDLKAYLGDLIKHRFTIMTGVNTLYNAMMNHPDFAKVDFSNLKVTIGGGMAVQQAVATKWKEMTGVALLEGYGLTETAPVLCCNPLKGTEQIGTIGLPFPNTDIKIMDDEGNEVPQGESGDLCAKGPQVMPGYWNKKEETEAVFTADGWFKTGDIAIMKEDGYFKIVDRKKDMILVSGFNVYPNEVEDVVVAHAKVLEVAAVGVPDEKSTEAVKLFIVKKDDSLTMDEIKGYCRGHLTGYKCPKHIEFQDELPKSNVGKILRRFLRDEERAKAS